MIAESERRVRRARNMVMLALVAGLAVTGCSNLLDELLEVELPGAVVGGDLNDPRLAATLARSAQNDFECGFREFARWTGIWTSAIQDLGGGRPDNLLQTRANSYNFYADHCEGTEPNYSPIQTSRAAGKLAYDLISGFSAADVADREELLASSKLYEAYSLLLLSETYCRVTFDNGPLLTQREGLQLADAAFGVALGHNPSSEIRNAALVGRARTALMLGNGADVVQYASQVPMDFVFWATYDDNPNRRQNYFYNAFFIGTSTSVGVKNRHLQFLGGVADPRVPIVKSTRTSAQAQNLPIWESHKYLSLGADIPIGTGREAMIMIAEVELGQTAVDIINQLRATPSTYVPENPSLFPNGWPDFPVFASTDPAEILAEVKDERRRETFLQGSEVGDLLRWGDPFPLGGDERGRAYDESNTCMHVPEFEEVANPNIETTPPRTPSL